MKTVHHFPHCTTIVGPTWIYPAWMSDRLADFIHRRWLVRWLFMVTLLLMVASSAHATKQLKSYQTGTVTAHHYTTTTTTVKCSSGRYETDCNSYDTDSDNAIYDLTLVDGTTHVIEHVLWRRNPLKGISSDPLKVKYRIWRKGFTDYVMILDTDGKEGMYTFAYHDGLNRKTNTEKAYGPAPVAH